MSAKNAGAIQEDLPSGTAIVADSEVACAEACDGAPGCNGASYYTDPEYLPDTDKNCWFKTFVDTCAIPADSSEAQSVILLLKPTADCAPLLTRRIFIE